MLWCNKNKAKAEEAVERLRTNMDRKTFTEVAEYIAAAALAIIIAFILADQLATPLWGGLSDVHFR
jgi:hypothetical protein